MLVQYKVDIIIISLNVTCSRHDTAEKLDTDKVAPLGHIILILSQTFS
jgi:hypothetical protein